MTGAELEELVDMITERIVESLTSSVISSVLPAEIGQWIRDTCRHSQLVYRHMTPMPGAGCFHGEWKLSPDGTMQLELSDTNARPFWRGTFRPEP